MKARQQSLHDQGWQSGAGQETHAEKLDDVRVAERAHYSAFFKNCDVALRIAAGGTCAEFRKTSWIFLAAQMAPGTATSSTLP